ncbi:MAG: HAMP domain-containing protein [Erysipelotrichia bacterium]|nr:HAMP domain-containing protein [Erysipelotrichia bacterium]
MSEKMRLWRWIAFIFCFIAVPGSLMFYGMNYMQQQASEKNLNEAREEVNQLYKDLQIFADPQNFWCRFLTQQFSDGEIDKNNPEKSIAKKISELRKNLYFDYVVYSPESGPLSTSLALKPRQDWNLALNLAWKVSFNRRDKVTEEEQLASGRVFGPQLSWEHFDDSHNNTTPYLIWADSKLEKPLIWEITIHKILVMIFIRPADLDSKEGIWNLLSEFSKKSASRFNFSIQTGNNTFRHAQQEYAREIEKSKTDARQQQSTFQVTDRLLIFSHFLRPDLTIHGYITQDSIVDRSFSKPFILLGLIFIIISTGLGNYSYRLSTNKTTDKISLRWKLRFLFFFANGLPLLVLFFIGTDYLNQKRDTLLREIHGKGMAFLQHFDEKLEIEYARTIVAKKKAEKRMIKRIAQENLSNKILEEFVESLGEHAKKTALVVNGSDAVATNGGIYDAKAGLAPANRDDRWKNQMDYTRKVGQFFLDKINGTKMSEKTSTEFEIFIESVTQKPLANFIYELLRKRGSFIQWGFGQNVDPAIIDTFNLENSTKADFFFLTTFNSLFFQQAFLEKHISQANRNDIGLKIIAMRSADSSVPRKAYLNTALREFAMTLTSYPGNELKYIDYEAERHLAIGIEGKNINGYKLVGLFPLEIIDSTIAKQRRQLFLFAVLSLLMTFGLAQVIAHGFLVPLQLITSGAHAIESKNFSHRLPDLGMDEFGAMGQIFNNVMVDLEELSVASAIQEQLLPQQAINSGKFSLFGRSISMSELGGDYYDFLELPDNKFSVLLGDVAGHGVGAALIMAMAKAAIIQSDHLLNQPAALLERLHKLIYNSKTKKQKKIMTFQYLQLDKDTGKGTYSNAGACSPMIIRKKSGTVEELSLTGAALGAFKKGNFTETEVVFNSGDAIIFYTDGIVEARNEKNEELGYDNLKTLLYKAWDTNAETFYQNIFREYTEYIGNREAQDDLTMVILVYTPSGETDQSEVIKQTNA